MMKFSLRFVIFLSSIASILVKGHVVPNSVSTKKNEDNSGDLKWIAINPLSAFVVFCAILITCARCRRNSSPDPAQDSSKPWYDLQHTTVRRHNVQSDPISTDSEAAHPRRLSNAPSSGPLPRVDSFGRRLSRIISGRDSSAEEKVRAITSKLKDAGDDEEKSDSSFDDSESGPIDIDVQLKVVSSGSSSSSAVPSLATAEQSKSSTTEQCPAGGIDGEVAVPRKESDTPADTWVEVRYESEETKATPPPEAQGSDNNQNEHPVAIVTKIDSDEGGWVKVQEVSDQTKAISEATAAITTDSQQEETAQADNSSADLNQGAAVPDSQKPPEPPAQQQETNEVSQVEQVQQEN